MNYDSTFCRVRQEVEFFYDMGIFCKIKPSGGCTRRGKVYSRKALCLKLPYKNQEVLECLWKRIKGNT